MKKITLYVSLIYSALAYHDAMAQGFWYVPPGYEYGSYNGLDFGSGVGFGYGYGSGLALTSDPTTGFLGSNFVQAPEQNDEMTSQTMFEVEDFSDISFQSRQLKSKVPVVEKHGLPLKHAKPIEQGHHADSGILLALRIGQLDLSTGKAVWPRALLRDTFALQRTEIESLLKSRGQPGARSEREMAITRKVQAMHQELRRHIREIDTKEYLEASKFLASLS